jgi:hypothetical protein
MFLSTQRRASAFAVALLPFLMVACGPDNSTAPASLTSGGGLSYAAADLGAGDGVAKFEEIEVCKYGSTADVQVDFVQASSGNTSVTYSFADGECRVLGNFDGAAVGPADITAAESNIPGGFQFDSVRTTVIGRNGATGSVTTSTTNAFSYLGADNDVGILVEFYNSQIPVTGGGEGCTPGYWKQPHHFDSWVGYAPGDLFSSVFEDAFPGMTLLQVISTGGNSAGEALGRHTVAALLNASSGSGVSYDLTTAEVIAGFNAAWPGSKNQLNAQKAIFSGFNEQGCPLN